MTSPRMSPPTAEAGRLGSELRAIRLNLTSDAVSNPNPITQSEMARRIYVGGKSVVSLYESGRRLPSDEALQQYANLGHLSLDELRRLRSCAQQSVLRPSDDPADSSPPRPVASKTTAHSFRSRRIPLVGGLVAVLAVAAAAFALTKSSSGSPAHVSIDSPTGLVDRTVSVSGTVTGYVNYNLWLDEQTDRGDRHHPTEEPCHRADGHFDFGTLYLGNIGDHSRAFHIRVIATRAGSAADRALMIYGRRPKTMPNAYLGLAVLPKGAQTVASIVVVRR